MADLPGDPAEPAIAVLGPEAAGAGGRRAAGAVGGARRGLLRQGVWHDLSRPAAHAGRGARPETDRFSLAAMFVLAALCLLAGILPGLVIDALAPAVKGAGRRTHAVADRRRRGSPSCRSPRAAAPTTACSCSCSWSSRARSRRPPSTVSLRDALRRGAGLGLRLSRSRARRRSTPPQASRSRSAACSAPSCSARARRARCRRLATCGPARLTVELRDLIWEAIYAPIAGGVVYAAERLNHLQFLTIRKYLSLVFAACRTPASGARDMAMIFDLAIQGTQMLLVLLLAPLLTGLVRKVKARLDAPRRVRRCSSPIATWRGSCARRPCSPRTPPGCSASTPYLIFAAHLGGGGAGADLRDRAAVLLVGRPHRHYRAARQRALLPGARRAGRWHQLRRHRLEPRGDDRLARRAGDADDRVYAGADRRFDPAFDHRRIHECRRQWGCACRWAWRCLR